MSDPHRVPLEPPERALAIGAHPDDIEFGCGATLARWARAGTRVDLLVLTDGSKGTWDEEHDLASLIATRQAEARAAAAALGAHTVHHVDLVDGELQSGLAERSMVCRVIREAQPDVVLGHDPWTRYRLHPDHRHAGWLTVDGVVAARDPQFFPGVGGRHHRPRLLLLFEAEEPDHFEPVDDDAMEAKVAALLSHRSQWRSTMGIDAGSDREDAQRRAFVDRVEAAVRAHVDVAGTRAEAFRILEEL